MTLSQSTSSISYSGDGTTTSFSVPYLFYANADLVVTVDGVVQTLDTDYTVTGAGVAAGGDIAFTTAPADETTVLIRRVVDVTQETDFENFDGNPADVTEKQFDLCVMMIQQIEEELDRSPTAAVGTAITDFTLPEPTAGAFLGWNSGGTALTNITAVDASTLTLPSSPSQYSIPVWGTVNTTLAESEASVDANGLDVSLGNVTGTIDLRTERTAGNIGSIRIYGDNAAAQATNTGAITSVWTQTTDGDEYSRMDFKCMRAGTLATGMFYEENITDITSLEISATENANFNLQSARSSDGDVLGYVQFIGKDSAAATTTYAQIAGEIEDNTDTTEDGRLAIRLVDAGTEADKLLLYTTAGTLTHQLKATANVANYYTSDRNSSNLVINWYQGQDSGTNVTNYAKEAYAVVDATDGSEDGEIVWSTVGAGTLTDRMNLRLGMWMEGATGGDQGAGTGNFTAAYDDGVALSCYPFDAYLDGDIDLAKWDAKVPDRHWKAEYEDLLDTRKTTEWEKKETVDPHTGIVSETHTKVEKRTPVIVGQREVKPARVEERVHEEARKFKALLGTEYDPLDPAKHAQHFKDKRHLPMLPDEAVFDPQKPLSIGKWLNGLIAELEVAAIHKDIMLQQIEELRAEIAELKRGNAP